MKKCLICGILILLLCTLGVIVKSYGLYEDIKTEGIEAPIASFVIKINNTDIDGSNKTFTIDSLTVSNDSNTRPGVLAPGTVGYFDIVLDPTKVDVAIRYDISMDFSVIPNDNIQVLGIENQTSTSSLIRTGETTYTGIINKANVINNQINTIRTSITWIESDNEEDDYELSGLQISIPVSVKITQYLGESIEAYIE